MMTENNQNLVPEIRFNSFTNAWEKRAWLDTVDISTNMVDPKTGYYDELPHIGPGNIESFTGILSNVRLVREENLISSKFHFRSGDIIYGKIRPNLAKYVLIDFEGLASADAYVLNSKNGLEQSFLYRILQTKDFYDYSVSVSQRTGMPKINREELNQYNFLMPCSKEQIAIGNFFRTFDDTFTLHKRKLDVLVTLKDGFLQQMFPAANEVVPRVRFAGFTGNWEERRLGEMLTERNEQFEESEDYPLMSFVGNVGVVPKGEQYDRSFLVKGDGKKYKKTELNDFIYSSNNLETGSIGLNRTGKAVISPVYSIFYSSNDSESLFVGLLSKRKDFINKMIHYRQGVMYGQWRIHERDFLKIIVLTPTISEQNRIIDFFKNFDEQIAAQTAKLEQLRQLKAAYLQRMFI
ncbi:restriction endonuclease subunit S [Paenibacillus polymyxa]|uniref:restriction endonuclease subunit S n=1 Tax=Paenibacillus polymyxa TaxID=1406 RepID=UPI0020259E63|nr:restriction endonuclease subunit S [Paenibacillus polymyxa]URJ47071.3 restriction endonuclease subunit S [Paenibacillus polymyxa]